MSVLDSGPVPFGVAPMDMVADLHGDPLRAGLVAFLNGNQFMAAVDAVAAFQRSHPHYGPVFYETLPPGVLVAQLRRGGLKMGELVITVAPDVITASPRELHALRADGLVDGVEEYASNDLAVLVPHGNPAGVRSLEDLGRDDVRVAMPDPEREGVGRLCVDALRSVGGEALQRAVMETKVRAGTTRLTQIHHRESPLWLTQGEVDAAPVWSTEARYHEAQNAGYETIAIPAAHNQVGRYAVAVVTGAGHAEAARAFATFLAGEQGRAIYADHGFSPPVSR